MKFLTTYQVASELETIIKEAKKGPTLVTPDSRAGAMPPAGKSGKWVRNIEHWFYLHCMTNTKS